MDDARPEISSQNPLLIGSSCKGGSVLFAETTFWDVFWYMAIFFLWIMFFWIFISVVADIFRRDDMSGWAKAGWRARAEAASALATARVRILIRDLIP